jgi:hypothetical protein
MELLGLVGHAIRATMTEKSASVLFVVFTACAQQLQLSPGGVITGSLRGDDGTAISGAYVGLHLLRPYPPGRLRATEWFATSGAGGSFRFDVPYFGQYRLCAQVPNSTWLNPCEWGLQPPVTSLSSAQKSVSLTMVVKRGVAIPIRVDDPGQLLKLHEGKTAGAHLLMGVPSDSFVFHPATMVSTDANGRNLQVVIPFDAPIKLVVSSAFFRLADAAGQPLARPGSTAIPVTAPSGRQPPVLRLVVTGSAK